MGPTTAEMALQQMEQGVLDPRAKLSITLTHYEWANLLLQLRKPQPVPPFGEGLQLGRLAWMCIGHIEGRVAGVPESSID